MMQRSEQLRITEIFYSLQGESVHTGLPTVFVRLTGCPLRCHYCDTAYAFHGGQRLSFDDIIHQVSQYKTLYVCITGGEPLAQPGCLALMKSLCDLDYHVSLETSGAIDCAPVDPRVMMVMDLKTPGSGECQKNKWDNLTYLKPTDQIKFVMCDRADYDWACSIMDQHQLTQRCQVLFSPSANQLDPTTLADWIIADRMPVRFQIQLHKILWHDAPGH